MKGKTIVKGIISYVLALILTVVFALFLNANVGWYMLIALILAPILSVFFAWLTARSITAKCDMTEGRVSKGDICDMTLTVQNRSIFPTTPLEIHILNGMGVASDNDKILLSVLSLGKRDTNIKFKASICGCSTVGISEIRVTDYLGLFSFAVKRITYDELQKRISVIPDIADVAFRDDRILKVIQASGHGDDSEDTVETDVNSFGGFPGYDNREYVPGDPLKRINWKLSAKRNKLLVRLDDEMAAQSVNVVLDSVCATHNPKMAMDAVENSLGIIKTLVLNSFKVNFYVNNDGEFFQYVIEDEKDIESVRLGMADYEFKHSPDITRLPSKELLTDDSAFVYVTPNRQGLTCEMLEQYVGNGCFSIFSSFEDNVEINIKKVASKPVNTKTTITSLIIPYLLSAVLSVTVFAAFGIGTLSFWTIIQAAVCAGIMALCVFVRKHKIKGGLMITILIFLLLTGAVFLANSGGSYIQWFMSGGDVVENTTEFLTTLILIFTSFFTMVIFYYTQVQYRTSMLLLCSIIPFVVYVKLIRDIEIQYVMLVVGLNVLAFLINNRKKRDSGKRIVGIRSGALSVALYALFFVLIALAVPTSDKTRFYHVFEDRFLGGNTTVTIPSEYSVNNEYSGNADNLNQLTNRKLYSIVNYDSDNPLYLRRQVFDYYDFEFNRWYGDTYYSDHYIDAQIELDNEKEFNLNALIKVMLQAEELSPGFLEKYGLDNIVYYEPQDNQREMVIMAQNFMNYSLITPLGTIDISASYDSGVSISASSHDTFVFKMDNPGRYMSYEIQFYDKCDTIQRLVKIGFDADNLEESMQMFDELINILDGHEESLKTVYEFYYNARSAKIYKDDCNKYTDEIPQKVADLALEITADCVSDWDKAKALEKYFIESDFVYDLNYVAPDDSVEYFLFEGRTGTCSDFASAYVLMARAAGLTVRYVEGFVPDKEASVKYDVEYVVRTKSSHAYPEVYIPNIGYVVFEPTVAAISDGGDTEDNLVVSFVVTLGYRILLIFAAVSAVIIITLFFIKVLAPIVREQYFLNKVRKSQPDKAVVMLYERLRDRYHGRKIKDSDTLTPYEFAAVFEQVMECDISPLIYLVEQSAYQNKPLDEQDKINVIRIYRTAKKAAWKHRRVK